MAASLGGITSDQVGADSAVVASCDTDRREVVRGVSMSPTPSAKQTEGVNVLIT